MQDCTSPRETFMVCSPRLLPPISMHGCGKWTPPSRSPSPLEERARVGGATSGVLLLLQPRRGKEGAGEAGRTPNPGQGSIQGACVRSGARNPLRQWPRRGVRQKVDTAKKLTSDRGIDLSPPPRVLGATRRALPQTRDPHPAKPDELRDGETRRVHIELGLPLSGPCLIGWGGFVF